MIDLKENTLKDNCYVGPLAKFGVNRAENGTLHVCGIVKGQESYKGLVSVAAAKQALLDDAFPHGRLRQPVPNGSVLMELRMDVT